jgi:hypothetical protein
MFKAALADIGAAAFLVIADPRHCVRTAFANPVV